MSLRCVNLQLMTLKMIKTLVIGKILFISEFNGQQMPVCKYARVFQVHGTAGLDFKSMRGENKIWEVYFTPEGVQSGKVHLILGCYVMCVSDQLSLC